MTVADVGLRIAVRPSEEDETDAAAWGWLPALSLVAAVGLALGSAADTGARNGAAWAPALFWLGLIVVFAPIAARLAARDAVRRERLGLLVVLGLALYTAKIMHSPIQFTFHDELGQWRSTDDIVRTGHLFRRNPIVDAYPFYPGLEIVTATLVKLGGLSIFAAGVAVLGAARVVYMVGLFLVLERIGGSSRLAAVGALVYAANPNFIYFDAQFAYESLALPLALLAIAGVGRVRKDGPRLRQAVEALMVAVLIAATVITHHLASYALAAFLAGWATLRLLVRPVGRGNAIVSRFAATAAGFAALWYGLVARGHTASELAPAGHGVVALFHYLAGGSSGKQLFHSSSGQSEAPAAQVIGFASVALILVVLPFGLRRVWRGYRRNGAALVLAAAAILYLPSLALRLTSAGTETSNRASEYVFLGLGFVLAAWIVDWWLAARAPLRGRLAAFAMYATVIFLGGLIVGWPPFERLPGPYLVAAGSRSVSPQGVATAWWARANLAEGGRVMTDETDALLFAAYGRQDPQSGVIDGIAVPRLFTSPTFDAKDRTIVRGDRIDEVVVDRRLSEALPRIGHYFQGGEPLGDRYRRPISERALAKFAYVENASLAYDNGAIRVYETKPLQRP